jgi:hypothetical protein
MFSVALSVGSHPPGVTWHLVLWSPDFPLRLRSDCPADSCIHDTGEVINKGSFQMITGITAANESLPQNKQSDQPDLLAEISNAR